MPIRLSPLAPLQARHLPHHLDRKPCLQFRRADPGGGCGLDDDVHYRIPMNMVALVQASTALPIMLFSLISGALADNFDRRQHDADRRSASCLPSRRCSPSVPYLGLVTPWLLLVFTFLIGCGTALNNPSWQASVGDMVPRDDLPARGDAEQHGLQHHPQRRSGDRRRHRRGRGCRGRLRRQYASAILRSSIALTRWKPVAAATTGCRARRLGQCDFRRASLRRRCRPTLARCCVRGFVFGLCGERHARASAAGRTRSRRRRPADLRHHARRLRRRRDRRRRSSMRRTARDAQRARRSSATPLPVLPSAPWSSAHQPACLADLPRAARFRRLLGAGAVAVQHDRYSFRRRAGSSAGRFRSTRR